MNNIKKLFFVILTMLFGIGQLSILNFQLGEAFAQEITVTVTPTQQVLPPQVMLYITEPANYFNISLSNTGKDNENIYLVMQIEQTNPSTGLGMSTPPKRQPQVPIVVPAGGTRILTPGEIRGLFNHIPVNEIKAPEGLFDNYTDGSFGLLPEGEYELHLTAYHWNPGSEPYVVSSPAGGVAYFSVCYKAQAPEFLTPMAAGASAFDLFSVAELDPQSPLMTWKAPLVACNPSLIQYDYSIRIVELLPGQLPDNSMDNNPVIYQSSSLSTPQCMVPFSVIKQMKAGKTYAAQVTATPANSNNKMLNFVSIENKGKSTYHLFRLKDDGTTNVDNDEMPKAPEPEDVEENDNKDEDKESDKIEEEKEEEDEDDITINMGDVKTNEIVEDSLYTFRNPKIIDPYFQDTNGVRKRFVETGIEVAWERPQFVGGEGQQNDTIRIEYEVQLFDNGERADKEDALQQEPIYTFRTDEQKDTIEWADMAEAAEAGDYMVLRIKPIVSHGSSVAFTGDDNVVDFALCNRLSQQYFQCSSTTEIENTKPTTKSASDFKGKQVSIGEYLMTIDDISGNGTDGFKGKGRVLWEPFGSKIMVCVTFDKLKINIDDVVYEGTAVSETAPQMSSNKECVDKLFSDWGIDNLIGDTGIPYASQLQSTSTGAVKSLAEQINISKYYQAIKDGEGLYDLITSGGMDKLYTPIKFPTEVLPKGWDVVDIQIADMKFAPDHATMNIIGQSILPECDVLKSKMLVFGAPRVCISPNRFLPESGQIALLGDFTLGTSDFEMTFKAPQNVLEPKDGCYISWHADTLELLGIDADMKFAGIVKDDNGKPTTERPVMNLKASFGSWSDFLVDNITIEDFQVEDLPGYTFTASNIVYDHSDRRNSAHMGAFPEKYSKSKAGIKGNEESWHGLHIGEIAVRLPKSLQLGEKNEDGDYRLKLVGEEMFFDQSGVTLKMGAENVFSAKEGTLGGFGISLDKAVLQIIQDDFDNCMFKGQLNIPIFGTKEKDKNGKEKFGNVDYTCEIRRLTDPRPRSKVSESINPTELQKTRYSYVFLTEQVDDLNFNCLVADVDLDYKQTYFLVEAYDDEKEDKINTQVELCIGGTIGIGGVDTANEWLKEKTKSLPLEVKIPDIHFTKMRLSNVKRADWHSISDFATKKRKEREAREIEVEKELKKSLAYYQIAASEEMEFGENFYLDLGEWSLASAKKRLGPFSFSLDKFKPSLKNSKLSVEVAGTVGLIEDKINVGATIEILADVHTPGTDISEWSIDDGDIKFRGLSLDLDFTALHLKGELNVIEDGTDHGYKGDLDISITGLFSLTCAGGYFEHEADANSLAGMKDEGIDTKTLDAGDRKYSWGYFMVKVESSTGIRVDPLVINRISGGFFFNCRPTKGKDTETDKFGGDPEPFYGNIGVAFGMKLSTSAGEKTLSANMDLLVCYDRQNNCLSTFMFNGDLKAVGGIINAKASLIYENQKTQGGATQNRYLCLNVTVEAGADTKALIADVTKANAALESLKGTLDKFQENVDDIANKMVVNPTQGLKQLSGKYDGDKSQEVAEDDTEDSDITAEVKEKNAKDVSNTLGATAMKTKISLEFKITWVKNGAEYNTPKWHLYLGEPEKDKRCSFTFLKFNGKIVTVDIGADAYLCLGNELPNNGALPAIPSKITEFLSGHKSGSTDMGADLAKAERSRKKAAQALLGDDINGGVMVGASAWGYIKVDLGLLYGYIDAIAGFDASLVNYGSSAFCVNSGSKMGKDGWYAMGQLYAYLAAELGIHVKIGSFINEKISIFHAGIGGVLELGLPNPTWVEGQARIKISLLGGLCKINKKFEFSAGDHCVPFKGNALDGFEMFQDVSLGSDSLYQALMDPTFAISANEANNMTFTTTSSIGSHYRLLDPSYVDDIAKNMETNEEDLKEKLATYASRTYVFDVSQDKDAETNMKMGVRLFDLGTDPTTWIANNNGEPLSESDFYKKMGRTSEKNSYNNMRQMVSSYFNTRENTICESSKKRKGRALSNGEDGYLHTDNHSSNIDKFMDWGYHVGFSSSNSWGIKDKKEVNVSFREDKGTMFHLTNMNLEPGHAYAMFLVAEAYEIVNGERVWCEYIENGKKYYIQWRQHKAWFFRVKSDEEEKIVTDSLRDLQPYIALAYPSIDGTKVVDNRGEGSMKAYYNDILHPTIALNRDISGNVPAEKMKWVLTAITAQGDTLSVQERDAKYFKNGNCINLEPATAFKDFDEFTAAHSNATGTGKSYDFDNEIYHLELVYTYQKSSAEKCKYTNCDSTFHLVDLTLISLPHDVKTANGTYTDSWNLTTSVDNTELLPYSLPFVGARIYQEPVFDYEKEMKEQADADHVFYNKKYSKYDIPFRLLDPYLYFAYLGKWTFIGDRAVNKYDFDDAPIPFGTETVIFNYNGTTVNTEFLKNETSKTLNEVRDQMYGLWNDWQYNNTNMPYYPLPTLAKTVGGITVNNQDGKTSTITPININHYSDWTFSFQNLVKDFTAPYTLATDFCEKLKQETRDLTAILYKHMAQEIETSNNYAYNDNLNADIKKWSANHRGRYIECDYRGFSVKVPYYQLPLIFGDCFGGSAKYHYTADGKSKTFSVDSKSRTFKATIGKSDITDKTRWPSESSNLLWFRLSDAAHKGTNFTQTVKDSKGNSKSTTYPGEAWLRYTGSEYADSYETTNNDERYIAWDQFNASKGMEAVTDFRAFLYRVNCYDMVAGLYTRYDNVGADYATKIVGINAGNATATNMSQMTDAITNQEHYLKTHYDQPMVQAIMTELNSNESRLWFVNSDSIYQASWEKYENGMVVATKIYKYNGEKIIKVCCMEEAGRTPWTSARSSCTSIYFDSSMSKAEIYNTRNWFSGFSKLKTVNYTGNLNTSKVTDMAGMFKNCSSLTNLSISSWNVSNVKDMEGMFNGCEELKTLNITGWNTSKVEKMSNMFAYCYKLTEVKGIEKINTQKVKFMDGMFRDCETMDWAPLDNFTSENLVSVSAMFKGCTKMEEINLNGIEGMKLTYTSGMFAGCSKLKTLNIKCLTGNEENLTYKDFYDGMFVNVPSTLTSNINYGLVDKIKDQIPGKPSATYDENYIVVYGTLTDKPTTFSLTTTPSVTTTVVYDPITHTYVTTELGTNSNSNSNSSSGQTFTRASSSQNTGSTAQTTVSQTTISQGTTGIVRQSTVSQGTTATRRATLGLSTSSQDTYESGSSRREYGGLTLENSNESLGPVVMTREVTPVLVFMRKSAPKKDETTSVIVNGETKYVKVVNVWQGEDVLGKSYNQSKIPWSDVRADIKQVYIEQSFAQSPISTKNWFYGCTSLTDIYGLENLNTSRVESMESMFGNCSKLTELDLTHFKTNKLTNMSQMFWGCESLKELGFGYNWKTENVTDMSSLFSGCKLLQKLQFVYDFDTPNVENMANMFKDCEQLEYVNMSFNQEFNTEKVTNMSQMFQNCKRLKWIPRLTSTNSVTNMQQMFYNCESLENLNFTGYNLSKVTNMKYAFSNCKAMKDLNLSTFMGEKLTTYGSMFSGLNTLCTIYIPYNCKKEVLDQCPKSTFPNLVLIYPAYVIRYKVGGNAQLHFVGSETTLKVGDKYNGYTIDAVWSGRDVIDSQSGWGNTSNPWHKDLSYPITKVTIDQSFKDVPIVNAAYFFSFYSKKCTSITGLQYLNLANAKDLTWMFSDYQGETLDLSQWNTQSATNMDWMFLNCPNLKTLKLGSNFKTDNVTSMTQMFSGCNSLESLDVSKFNTANVESMYAMFGGCHNLKSLDVSKFDVSKVKAAGNIGYMFHNCSSLKTLDISNFDMEKQTNMFGMFSGCESLESLDLSSLDLMNVKSWMSLFDNCTSLRKLVLGSLITPDIIRKESIGSQVYGAFENVHDLTVVTPPEKLEAIKEAFIEKLGFVDGVTGTFYDKEPEKTGQVLWINDEKSLVFFYGSPVGDYYNSQVVTKKWEGDNVLGNKGTFAPWTQEIASSVEKVKFDASFANARPTSTNAWFLNMSKLTEIENLKYLNTSEVTTMEDMFKMCSKLPSVDLSNFNTSKVTSMSYMFYYTGLEELDVSTFNTTNVTNMSRMFCQSDKLKKLDISNFNTSKVTSAPSLFNGCRALKELKLGQNCTFTKVWPKKSSVFTSVSGMEVLVHSSYLDAVEKSFTDDLGFTSSNGEFIAEDQRKAQVLWNSSDKKLTFVYTKELSAGKYYKGKYISKAWGETDVLGAAQTKTSPWASDLKSQVATVEFDPSFANVKVTKTSNWFKGCTNLSTVKGLENLKTASVTDMYGMFANCPSLEEIDLSSFDTKVVTSMSYMFDGCTSLKSLDLSNFNTEKLKYMTAMFRNCSDLTELKIGHFNTGSVTTMEALFQGCSKLPTADVEMWNTVKVTNMRYMFKGCAAMTEIKTGKFSTSNVTDMSYMFSGCSALKYPSVYSFDVTKVKNFAYMFFDCSSATTINLSQWTTPAATNMQAMFKQCSAASIIETSKFNTSNVTDMSYMFYKTNKLQSSWLSSFDTSKVTNMSYMFAYCGADYSNKWISVSNFNTANVTNMKGMFYGCSTLKSLDLTSFNMQKVTTVGSMFSYCSALSTLTIGNQFKPNLSSSTSNFYNISGLKVTIKNVSSASSDKYTIPGLLKKMGFTNNVTGTVQLTTGGPYNF